MSEAPAPASSPANPVDLIATLELGVSVAVAEDCLGTSHPISVAGVPGSLLVPRLEWNADRASIRAPRLPHPYEQQVHREFERDDHYHFWGMVTQRTTTTPSKAIVTRIPRMILVFPCVEGDDVTYQPSGTPLPGRVASQVFSAIDEWTRLLLRWVATYRKQYTVPDAPIDPFELPGNRLRLVVAQGASASPSVQWNRVHLTIERTVDTVRAGELRRICQLASDDVQPPVEHGLLVDARAALHRRETRRAVIDAGTAAELALTRMLDDDLAPLDASPRTAIRKERRTLGALAGLLKYRGLPDGLNDGLIMPRNAAAHRNEVPTRDVAARAVSLAEQLVASTCPLPATGDK